MVFPVRVVFKLFLGTQGRDCFNLGSSGFVVDGEVSSEKASLLNASYKNGAETMVSSFEGNEDFALHSAMYLLTFHGGRGF